ncbi:hypothetical protein JHK87_049472 [Glycine soja]|nr:hypothetical protein JHK87_049472 [Glycine soja]
MPASPSENQTRWRKRKRDSQISRRHQKHEEEEEEEDDDDDDENPNGATRSTIRRTKRTTTTVIRNLTWRRRSSPTTASEQDKEPEQEAVLEVVGPGPSEESGNDATKWSERKEAVVDLTKLASTKRISPGDFSEVCRTLKKVYYVHVRNDVTWPWVNYKHYR